MAETASRSVPPRGRGSTRGSRGGFRRTGGRNHDQSHSNYLDDNDDNDQGGEVGDLKKQFHEQLSQLKELFSDWAEVDLLLALRDAGGDLLSTIEHISAGNASQFSEVKKKTQDRSRSKVKESAATESSRAPRVRNATTEASRGRGRGERGRSSRPARGGAHGDNSKSVPTAESNAWEASDSTDPSAKTVPSSTQAPTQAPPATAGPPKKTWASMFAPQPIPSQPTAPAVVSKAPVADPTPSSSEAGAPPSSDISQGYVEVTHSDLDEHDEPPVVKPPTIQLDESNIEIPPSKDKLTEDNVEHLPDVSQPAPTGTAASTVDSSRGPESNIAPISQAPIPRGLGGYATTAYKATTQSRSASFQRRVLEQQESVVLPANHAVEKTTVQFGSLNLNGADAENVDEAREEAETRQQLPQDSPQTQPRTSLPPASRSELAQQEPISKPAPGLSLPSKDSGLQQQQQPPIPQGPAAFNQFGRYPQSDAPQKSFDLFTQPTPQTASASASASENQSSNQNQSQLGGLGNANDYSYYQQSGDQRYNYYGGFGQNSTSGQPEPRNGGTFSNTSGAVTGTPSASNDNSFPSNQSQQSNRFGDNQQVSGNNTPNATNPQPHIPQQPQQPQQQHHHHQQQQQQQQQHQGQGGYYGGHPYYNTPYYQAYMNQYGYGQQGFGGQFGKQGIYGHPNHAYGGYDQQHSSTPGSGFGGDSNFRGSLGSDFGRSGSAAPSQAHTGGGFGNLQESSFGRPSGFPGPNQGFGQQSTSQQSGEENLKPLGEKGSTTSPNPLGQQGRPSSTNQGQSGLPPPQQSGFGQYPSQLGGQGSQYSGLGNFGHQQGQQGQQQGQQQQQQQQGGGSGYSGYGSSFGNNYPQYGGRGWNSYNNAH